MADRIRREGLTILGDPPNSQADIVFVHGLNGHPHDSWTDSSTGFYWPRHLAESSQKVRVITFGYIADFHASKDNLMGIRQYAEGLLVNLRNNRPKELSKRPIVFICHSLGGLLVKQALLLSQRKPSFSSIVAATRAIFFFGTPHAGSHNLDKTKVWIVEKIAKVASYEIPENLKSVLQPRANELFVINDEFPLVKEKISIVNFYEQRKTAILNELVVDKTSATTHYGDEENVALFRDHQSLIGYSSADDDIYRTVQQTMDVKLSDILEAVPQTGVCLKSLRHQSFYNQNIDICDASENTLAWVWEEETGLTKWLGHERGLFWIGGKPGSGKSTLMKSIWLQYGERPQSADDTIVAHFFSKGRTPFEERFESLLMHVLLRLLGKYPSLFETVIDIVRSLVRSCESETSDLHWSFGSLKKCLMRMLRDGRQIVKMCLLVDALDECQDVSIRECIAFFLELASSQQKVGVKVCFSSRYVPEDLITGSLGPNGFLLEDKNLTCIANYVKDRLSIMGTSQGTVNVQEELEKEIIRKADGIFLWVKIVLQELENASEDGAVFAELKKILVAVPGKLSGLFQSLLEKIGEGFLTETNDMLALVLSAQRPLLISECRLAFAFGRGSWFESQAAMRLSGETVQDDVIMKRRIRSRCGGILEVRTYHSFGSDEEVLQFIHPTVKDFLLENTANTKISTREDLILRGHQLLLRSCVAYLQLGELHDLIRKLKNTRGRRGTSKNRIEAIMKDYPFLRYAVEEWFKHAKEVERSDGAQIVDSFLNSDSEHFDVWRDIYNYLNPGDKFETTMTPFSMAVQSGLVEHVKTRVREGVDVNERIFPDGHYLQLAVRAGHVDMVQALLELNADVDAQGGKCICALHAAALYGQEDIMVVLLNNGADMSITTPSGENVLTAAALGCEQSIMKLLLDRGYEVFNDNWSCHGALYIFSIRMMGWDNDEEFPNGLDPTTLEVITRMTRYGLDFTASTPGCTAAALWLLVAESKDAIQMMITKGVNINERIHQDLPLLMLAAMFTSENAIRNLVECGAELGVENESGDTVLHNAVINKSDSVLQYLLSLGLNCNNANDAGQTPLHMAAAAGSERQIALLLAANADTTATVEHGENILHFAMQNHKCENITACIGTLPSIVDINARNMDGLTPLHAAVSKGTLKHVKWALDLGADMRSVDKERTSVLHLAATNDSENREEILKFLLDSGADISATDEDGMTVLHYALCNVESLAKGKKNGPTPQEKRTRGLGLFSGLEEFLDLFTELREMARGFDDQAVLTLLLDRGSQVNAQDDSGTTALHMACSHRTITAADILLSKGAKLDEQDVNGNTPLHLATAFQSVDFVDYLLSKGAKTDVLDYRGCTPLDLAPNEEVRELLESRMEKRAQAIAWPPKETI